ncbi:MAG: GFA family protein [Caulobacteraceae bacterium]|jgi:hypothetical protein
MRIDGGCHCGAIRYEAEVNPDNVVICHCTDCQTISGAPYRTSIRVRLSKFNLQGEPKTYWKVGDSGRGVMTAFCGDCGSALYSHRSDADFVNLRVGSASQRRSLPPKAQGFCGSAMPWAMDIRDVPEIPPKPPRSAATDS